MNEKWRKIKEKWGQLADGELSKAIESKDKLIALIRDTYGQSKESIEQQLKELEVNKDESVTQQFVDTVVTKGEELERQIADYSEQFSENIKAYVRNNPMSSVIWGLGIGYILGKLTK